MRLVPEGHANAGGRSTAAHSSSRFVPWIGAAPEAPTPQPASIAIAAIAIAAIAMEAASAPAIKVSRPGERVRVVVIAAMVSRARADQTVDEAGMKRRPRVTPRCSTSAALTGASATSRRSSADMLVMIPASNPHGWMRAK